VSRSFYKGFRDQSSMRTDRLLKSEHVWVVSFSGEIKKLTQAEWQTWLHDKSSRGISCLTEEEANVEAERRKAKLAAPGTVR
jgi:hypothetical protein